MKGTKKWSRDWADFDWSQVKNKITEMEGKGGDVKAGYDVGISKDEFLEYLDWLNQNSKERYCRVILSMELSEMGINESQVETLVAHPDELIRILKAVLLE